MDKPVMRVEELERFLQDEFPQINADGQAFTIDSIEPGRAVMRLNPNQRHLRPGGTVSGPTLFTLADLAAYVVILGHIGPVALAVTTNLSINFLRKPADGQPLFGTGRLLKLGRRLAVVDVAITDESGMLVAQASATYSIPPDRVAVVK
ncbi:PaaI family thioesterase [Pararhizobium haloflavum]|uniref:PaaI family thioesterase n=1 Tax=Pararhizobium haloflavum TaxID=2037914 RepID=UPI000C1A53A8|nr:PaaI family thioesterase [Pararhizobium haloflavum]